MSHVVKEILCNTICHLRSFPIVYCNAGANDDWKNYFTVAQNEMYDEIFNKEMHDMHNLIHRIQFE